MNVRNEQGGILFQDSMLKKVHLTWLCFPSEMGEGEVVEYQVYGGLVSSFGLSPLERCQGIGFQI